MSRRKGPRVEAAKPYQTTAILYDGDEVELMGGALVHVRAEAALFPGARAIVLREVVPADSDREAVVRAAVRWHARKISDDELLEAVDAYLQPAAVEKLQRKGRKP